MRSQRLILWAAGLAPAALFAAAALAQNPPGERAGDLVYQVQALQDEIRQLRGLIEQQDHEIARLQQRQRDQFLDLDQRLAALAAGSTAAAGRDALTPPGDAAPAQGASPPAVPPVEDVPEVRPPTAVEPEITTISPQVAAARQVAQPAADEQARYDAAFQEVKALRYDRAADAFRAFIADFPESALAGNAQYWLGESWYGSRNFTQAVAAFQALLDRYPESTKRPDALLKIGYSHYELKDWPAARAALEQVKAEYPDTTISRLAENRLRAMRLEGHY